MSSPDERKERVIHTRVPESLDDEIKAKARRLGVSVSNLVRNVLEHTVELVEDIVTDGADVARAAGDGRRSRASASAVLGWQRAVLELNAVCDRCNAILPRGCEAAIAVTAGGEPRFRCLSCLEGEPHEA
jgi:predicted DNA-binding protein